MPRWLRQIARQIFRARTDVIYVLPCAGVAAAPLLDHERLTILDSHNLAEHRRLCDEFLQFSPGNDAYLEDIANDRVVGLFVSVDDRIVHFGFLFISNRMHGILGLPETTARIGHSFTAADYRGRGCQGRSVLARARLAGERGFESVAAETTVDNLASQRGMEKAGMQLLGRMDLVVLFRYLIIRWRRPPGFALLGWSR